MDMASGEEKQPEIEDAPVASYRSPVWDHFGFNVTYDDGGKKVVDKTVTVCKHCRTRVVYANANTSNMLAHLRRHHPSVSLGSARRDSGRRGQLSLPAATHMTINEKKKRLKIIC